MANENLYELLQVQPTADADIIRAAFRRLILRYHPDRSSAADAQEMTQRLNNAYEILSDPEKRASYDRELRAGSSAAGAGQPRRGTSQGRPNQAPPRPSRPPPPRPPQPPPTSTRPGTGYVGGFPKQVWGAGFLGVFVVAAVSIAIIVGINTRGSAQEDSSLRVPARKLPTRRPLSAAATRPTAPVNGPKSAPVAKAEGLIKFLQWFHDSGSAAELHKMSPASLAAFGLGWYFSDTLTRDEKQAYQRHLEDEFNRSIKNQDDDKKARELERSGRRLKKSAFDELQDYYQSRIS